jgi:hypothetical protein
VGRVEHDNIADLDNTILKMAKKRAQVDGAIALARCADMCSLDVADFTHGELGGAAAALAKAPAAPRVLSVAFGPFKGKAISEMTNEELSASIDLAHSKLQEQPAAKWAKAMRENLSALETEVELRCRAPLATAQSASEPHTELPQ